MGQFKPMVKMMTTEPTVELKLKKGGHVSMKAQKGKYGHKMMVGGPAEGEVNVTSLPARGGMASAARPAAPSMAARNAAMAGRTMPSQSNKGGAMRGLERAAAMSGRTMPTTGRPAAMKEGGETAAEHKAEMAAIKGVDRKLSKHAAQAASKAHKGLKAGGVAQYANTKMDTAHRDTAHGTGEVKVGKPGGYKKGGKIKMADGGMTGLDRAAAMSGRTMPTTGRPALTGLARAAQMSGRTMPSTGQPVSTMKKGGGAKKYATSGEIPSEKTRGSYVETEMHEAAYDSAHGTGGVRMSNAGGFKKGGKAKFATGGGVKGMGVIDNVTTSKPGVTNTTTGGVREGNAGGFKKGGSAKKAYATGGSVNDSGRPVAYPHKAPSASVKNNLQSGTFKRGGKVKMKEGGDLEDLSKGAYDKSIGPSKEEMDMARAIRDIPSKLFRGAKRAFGMEPGEGSVTKTERSVTVTPGKKRGGKVC